MASNPWQRMAINQDVDAEFCYWKNQFVFAAWMAVGFAFAAGAAIVFWPDDAGNPEVRAFVRKVWTLFVEFTFWLGFLLGLLWGAAKRLGSALSGVLPWEPLHQLSRKAAIARSFGQWASCFALTGMVLAIARLFALPVDAGTASLFAVLKPLMQLFLSAAAVLALASIAVRERSPRD